MYRVSINAVHILRNLEIIFYMMELKIIMKMYHGSWKYQTSGQEEQKLK
jgi:hypothetical protein